MKSVKDRDTFYPTAYTPIESPYQSEERDYSSDGSADESYSLKGYSADGSADESYSLKGYSVSTMGRMLTRGQVKLSHAHETKIKHQSASDGAVPEEEGCWAGGWEDFAVLIETALIKQLHAEEEDTSCIGGWQKQARLARPVSIKGFSSLEEEDAEESLQPPRRNLHRPQCNFPCGIICWWWMMVLQSQQMNWA
jgi:hypothetical protein